MGTNFADGEGNVTAYLSWRHADAVAEQQLRFRRLRALSQRMRPRSHGNTVVGSHCGGSANSNLFSPNTGPQAGNAFSVLGNNFVPCATAATTPPADFNSQPLHLSDARGRSRQRGHTRHMKVTDYFQPYAEFYFMDDRTRSGRGACRGCSCRAIHSIQPRAAGYPVNCNNPFLSAQQQVDLVYAGADCGRQRESEARAAHWRPRALLSANCVDVEIGRRNIEGGGRFRITSMRTIARCWAARAT